MPNCSIKQVSGNFNGQRNFNLFYKGYLPTRKPKAILLIVHGLAEHSSRYLNVVNHFVPRGYIVYGFDQRGHGQSEGIRGYVEKFTNYIDDLKTFSDIVRSRHPDEKLFLIGHSVGGTIAIAYSLRYQSEFNGLVLSGATLQPGTSISLVKIMLARFLSIVTPKVGVNTIDASTISQDQAVVDDYMNDPLVYHGKIRARLGAELINTMQTLPKRLPEFHLPILIMSGTFDRLSNPDGSRLLYECVKSKDKTLRLYDGFYHEIFNEPGRDKVLSDMENWFANHL
ncbi:alpha/beta hydrolase [Chloroflexota bacterium]